MKRQTIIPSFDDQERIRTIMRLNPDSFIITKPDHQILYIENKYERYISAQKWKMSPADLEIFMVQNGDDYSYVSPASFALSLYRKRFAKQGYVMPHNDGFRAAEARRSLYGGRCEVFKFYQGVAHQYDINSSYPYAATQLTFPDPRSIIYIKPATISNIFEYEGFSRVLYTQEQHFPVLPARYHGRTVYANTEQREGVFTHTELRYAMENGVTIHKVLKQYIGDTLDHNPFIEFVTYCYNQRVKTENKVWKIIANGLFGRMAVMSDGLLKFTMNFDKSRYRETKQRYKDYFGAPFLASPMIIPPDSNILWAAMVLAKARSRIHYLLWQYNPVYCDTDCVFVINPIEDLVVSDKIGDFKHKSGEYNIRGAKLYTVDGAIKAKGMSARHRTMSDFFAAQITQERVQRDDGTTEPHVI